MSTLALIFVDLAILAALYLAWQKAFIGLIALMTWYEYAIGSVLGAALFWTIWPWLTRINASNDPTDATTFRAWRVNFLIGTIAVLTALTYIGYYLVVYLLAAFAVGTATSLISSTVGGLAILALLALTWPQLVAMGLGLGFGISGGLMLYYNKNFWYNYDPEGRRLTVEFSYFGDDVEIEDEEEEEPEEDDVGDAEFAEDDDFW